MSVQRLPIRFYPGSSPTLSHLIGCVAMSGAQFDRGCVCWKEGAGFSECGGFQGAHTPAAQYTTARRVCD